MFRDVMHVILAIVIIVMVVFAFLSPNKYAIFFPLIFLLFSVSCLLDAIKAIIMFILFLFMLLMSTIGFLNI